MGYPDRWDYRRRSGAIAAVNFVIFSGIEPGYEATISDVFRPSKLAGIVTVGILAVSPALGGWVMRRRRRRTGSSVL